MPSSRGSSRPRDRNCISCAAVSLFCWATREALLLSQLYESESESESCSVVSESLWPHGLYSPWNSPGQNTEAHRLSLLQVSSQPRDWTQVSHIAGRFFTNWAIREAHHGFLVNIYVDFSVIHCFKKKQTGTKPSGFLKSLFFMIFWIFTKFCLLWYLLGHWENSEFLGSLFHTVDIWSWLLGGISTEAVKQPLFSSSQASPHG